MDFEKARYNMVNQQIRPWDVSNEKVLAVFGEIPRESFTPAEYKNIAYTDTRIPIGYYEDHLLSMMQPNINGRILQNMHIGKDDLVLEIGTGTGYLTACLAKLARFVDSVEINSALTAQAEKNLSALAITNINLSTGDAAQDWDQKPCYDVIIINGSMPGIPPGYKTRLRTGGRMFVVCGNAPAMTACRVTRTAEDNWDVEPLFETCIDRLIHAGNPDTFVF